MDDAYDKFIHAKVEGFERRAYYVSLTQLLVGTLFAVIGVIIAIVNAGDPHVLLGIFGVGLALYLLAGGVFVPDWMLRSRRYTSFHPNPFRASRATTDQRNAIYDDVMGFKGTTPTLADLRRKAHIVFLLRMLGIVAIAAVVVVAVAIAVEDSRSKAMRHNHVTGEVWLTDQNGRWYGIGP